MPAAPAVIAKPTIIINHTAVAAAARFCPSTRIASNTSNDVPAAPTPKPIITKPAVASSMPSLGVSVINEVEYVAAMAPAASITIPPMIHGVRREP